ncbi:SDR family NAD(P)-dependent oxidoreductase [Microbacterium sp. KSW4-11]|uniref:SDR family NAD(P)-dependent oxidoreductase n=1 Tax=Microbacterium gawkjiense TaxID=3067309 RepID=A0ABU3GCS9_9MICO|nr:SDR family NAD(P)-dependent oxidoreductase [Microbacterium sp. KSW4-11]MDT3317614.1 SDR family NAD(P)-dependent oxidoreductase [Microbacterium sp. KSW4-11]
MPGAIVITGASSGIGPGFARRFAARGHDVVLVARRADRLESVAEELRGLHRIEATVLPADLADPAAPAAIAAALDERGIHPSGLVNSAGFGTASPFAEEDAARVAAEVQVNVAALTLLTRALLPHLIAARGVLVNVSSNAGHQPLPGLAVYAATKAYVTSLTEAIWQETRGTGLRVLALCPGPTETEFFTAAGSETFKVGATKSVDDVLDEAFAALDAANPSPVRTVGAANRVQGWAARVSPRRLRLWVAARAVGSA